MLTALQLLKATNLFPAEPLLNKYQITTNTASDSWLTLELNELDNGSDFQHNLLLLKEGITGKHKLQFIYYNQYGQTSLQTISPARIIFRQNSWYLLAFCHTNKEYQMFRLDHMRSISLTDQPANLPEPVQAPEPDTINVRLKFSKRLWYKVYDDFYGQDIERNDDGSYELELCLVNDDSLYTYLLSFGNNVEILSPRWLKKEMVQNLEVFLKNNQT